MFCLHKWSLWGDFKPVYQDPNGLPVFFVQYRCCQKCRKGQKRRVD